MSAPAVTTAQVLEALIRHYRKPGAARDGEILVTEPESPAGQRRCDLVRIGMWSSRGTGIDAHEIKVSRGDWLRELDDPAKAQAWWPYCSRFWVATPPGIVRQEELPDGWGLMEMPRAGQRRFRVIVKPGAKTPKLTLSLLVELMRRADNDRLAQIDQAEREHGNAIHKAVQDDRRNRAISGLPHALQQRLALLEEIEKAIGCPLTEYVWGCSPRLDEMSASELGAAMILLRDTGASVRLARWCEEVRGELRRAADGVLAHLAQQEPLTENARKAS
jgi:hypothetical protein